MVHASKVRGSTAYDGSRTWKISIVNLFVYCVELDYAVHYVSSGYEYIHDKHNNKDITTSMINLPKKDEDLLPLYHFVKKHDKVGTHDHLLNHPCTGFVWFWKKEMPRRYK